MNDIEFWKIVLFAIVALIGWFTVHWLNGIRDFKNVRRKIRLEYMIEAYRSITDAACRPSNGIEKLEQALQDIQLLGTEEQIEQLFKSEDDYTPLLEMLRKDLRSDLKQKKIKSSCFPIRFRRHD